MFTEEAISILRQMFTEEEISILEKKSNQIKKWFFIPNEDPENAYRFDGDNLLTATVNRCGIAEDTERLIEAETFKTDREFEDFVQSAKDANEVKQLQERLETFVEAKFRHPEITSVNDLLHILREIDDFNELHESDFPDVCGNQGVLFGYDNSPPIDYNDLVSDLPVFDAEPDYTEGIWSWDKEHVLEHDASEGWCTFTRKEWEEWHQ